jgi:hypothetical protein
MNSKSPGQLLEKMQRPNKKQYIDRPLFERSGREGSVFYFFYLSCCCIDLSKGEVHVEIELKHIQQIRSFFKYKCNTLLFFLDDLSVTNHPLCERMFSFFGSLAGN